ncbi:MAG: phytanoyl-CoA dioxygenase family protein [Blastopirellula sp.]|nr:MAG: phytanoyl-CoA dioxygenase family protein [Blastopirellula sp.]
MAVDLSTQHELVSDLFQYPKTAQDWEQYRLTQEQIDFYHEQGYLVGVKILNDVQVEALRGELAEFFDPDHDGRDLWYEYHANESATPNTTLFHALGAWRIRPGFHDVLWAPGFVMAASQLLGGSVRFWHDQLFCKPAKHGGVVAWHQDYSYWTRTKPMQHLTCWVGLDDATKENGCVHYIPRSHEWDLLPITGLAGDMSAIRDVLNDEQWEQFQHPVAAELKMGEATFHHPLMIHGSFENKIDRPRRATVINAFKDGVLSDAGEELLAGVPIVPKGEKMEGQFFPLLLEVESEE